MKKRILKIVGYTLLSILGIIVLLFILLQLPPVQSFIGNQLSNHFSSELNTNVEIDKVRLTPLGGVTVKEVSMLDHDDRLLLSSEKISGNLSIGRLLNQEIFITDIIIENTLANLIREEVDPVMNHHFLLEYFTPADTLPPSKVWGFDLGTVELNNVDFSFRDEWEKEYLTVVTDRIYMDFYTLGLEDKHIRLEDLVLDKTEIQYQTAPTTYDKVEKLVDETQGREAVVEPLEITVKNSNVNEVNFRFDDLSKQSIPEMVDFAHLDIQNINAVFGDVNIKGLDIFADIKKLSLKESSGFDLQQFESKISIDHEKIIAEKLLIETPQSSVKDYFSMHYKSFESFENFLTEVIMHLDFNETHLELQDLAYFIPGFYDNEYLRQQVDDVSLSGNFKGKLSNFIGNDLNILINESNSFEGRIAATDILEPEQMKITLNAHPLKVNLDLIESLLEPGTLPPELATFHQLNYSGEMVLTAHRLVATNSILLLDQNVFEGQAVIGNLQNIEQASFDVRIDRLLANEQLLDVVRNLAGPVPGDIDQINSAVASGQITGTMENLRINNMDLRLNNGEHVFTGDVQLQNISQPEQIYIDGNVSELSTNANFVASFLSPETLPDNFAQLGNINFIGAIEGRLNNNLNLRNAHLQAGGGEHVFRGNLQLRNISSPKQIYVNGKIAELRTNAEFLAAMMPPEGVPENFEELGTISYSGTIVGTASEINTAGTLITDQGTLLPDLYVNLKTAEYRGTLSAQGFNLAFLTADTLGLGVASFTVNFEGQGFEFEKLSAKGNFAIDVIAYQGYDYQDITFEGNIDQEVISGELLIQDPNLNLTFDGTVSLSEETPVYNFTASINRANMRALNLMEVQMSVSGDLNFKFQGTHLDVMTGEGIIRDLTVVQEEETFHMDSMQIASTIEGDTHSIEIRSDLLNASLVGDYQITKLPVAFENFVKDYYYERSYSPDEQGPPQQARLELFIYDAADVLTLFIPDLEQLNTGRLTANFNSAEESFQMEANFSSIQYLDFEVNNLIFNSEAEEDVITYWVGTSRIDITDSIQIPKTKLSGTFAERELAFNLEMPRDKDRTILHLAGTFLFDTDSVRLQLHPGNVIINEEDWSISSNNMIAFGKNYFRAENFVLSHEQMRISISSVLAGETTNNLDLNFRNVNIGDFMAMINYNNMNFGGRLDGTVHMENIFEAPAIEADITIDDFVLDNDSLGRIALTAEKTSGDNFTEVLYVHYLDGERARVKGTIANSNGDFNLDLKADLDRLPLKLAEPFTADFFANLDGFALGDLTIEGTTASPDINGQISLRDAEVTPTLNQTHYILSNTTININNSRINFEEMLLTDPSNNELTVNGNISHENLKDFRVNVTATTDMFQFLNTTRTDNEFFYGNVYASASIRVTGRLENPNIYVDAASEEGTEIFLPTVTSNQVMQYDFINYYPLQNERDRTYSVSNVGFDVRLNLDITPKAKIHVIMNPNTGEQLTSTGRGNLYITVDETNEMELYGSFSVIEGQYVFRMGDVLSIERVFKIKEGSRITWSGDPMDAAIDATAVYNVEASTYNLVQHQSTGISGDQLVSYQKEVPLNVLLFVGGDLYAPTIDFNIQLDEDVGYVGNEVSRLINQLRQNENELNKQVFSLIAFNQFIPQDVGGYSGSGGSQILDATVTSFVSRQLSSIATSQLGINVDIDIDEYQTTHYMGAGQTPTLRSNKRLEVALSKEFINDRLNISVGTGYDLQGNAAGVRDENSLLSNSNIVISYELTPKGNLVVKAFTKSDYDIFEEENEYKTGVGVSWSKAFNTLFGTKEEEPEVQSEETEN